MMASVQFVFYLTCLFLGETAHTNDLKFSLSVHQQRHFVSANTGDDVTLRCLYEGNDVARLYWYKLNLGKESKLLCTVNTVDNQAMFHDEFKSDPRFTVNFEKGKIDLQISDLQILDSATYYCASSYGYRFAFAEGTVIDVKGSGSNIPTLVQQSASETIQPGGSVTLNCTVHTGTCDEEHSVYWFRDSEDSFPRIIYSHGSRNDQCERKPNTQTHTCVYNLPMKSLNMSHAGTYYCAVASCGHILFGNGTKLDLEDEVGFLYLVHVLNGIVAFTCVLSLCLMSVLFVMTKKKSIHFTGKCCCKIFFCFSESHGSFSEDHQNILRENKTNRSRRQRDDTWSECIYFTVKQKS
ncbi:uncharacterized protein LOC102201019 [Pundamilia nyererei]|uniref:Uncharacterized protein LOC102201019 n=1 Tax=Pundamilia nyererei TaxID=303518 RepID=A0A9Y3S695_9CICH|nr:PREDICTED: uncharacterized protein LOC102201019 [Pundamilia nyererei]